MQILWDCAWESLILAFLVQIVGGVAVNLVGGLFRDMTPAAPPVHFSQPNLEAEPSAHWDFHWFAKHRFALIFGILFIGKVAGRFVSFSRNQEQRNATAWLNRVLRHVSAQWFSLVVGNAFVAFIAVVVIQISQHFSVTHWLWHWLGEMIRPVLQAVVSIFPGDAVRATKNLIGWYDANQFKFTFWLFYSAAICDDLGLPNYKTLGRYLRRRYFRRKTPVAPQSS